VWFLVIPAVLLAVFSAGARWGDRVPLPWRGSPPPLPTPDQTAAVPPADELLKTLDDRLAELRQQLAAATREEREATVARRLLRDLGVPADAPAYQEQERTCARAAERKVGLLAERNELLQLRAELIAAMADPGRAGPTASPELVTRVRAFVIRQQIANESRLTPATGTPVPR
jgi:hypothetical protein